MQPSFFTPPTHELRLDARVLLATNELAAHQLFANLTGAKACKRGGAPEGFTSLRAYRKYMAEALSVPKWTGTLVIRRMADGVIVKAHDMSGEDEPSPAANSAMLRHAA